MDSVRSLFQLVGGHQLPAEDDGPARRTQLVVLAGGASAALCAAYGFAIGGTDIAHAAGNLVRMPLVVLLSAAGALPASLVAWKIAGLQTRASDMVLGLASGMLTSSLVLAVMAPIVGLYYHTSTWLGPVLALATAGLALLTGLVVMWKAVMRRAGTPEMRRQSRLPLTVFMGVHFALVTQLIAISNIMPEHTVLDDGIEGIASRR